jgi:hypothetical protein
MDWIKQNKFLAGFVAFLVVVGGGLGFLAYTAKAKADQAYDTYQSKAQELKTLQNQQPFPSEANVRAMQDAQKAQQSAIDALQKEVAKSQIPLKPITPEKFQDNLRESIRRVTALAADRHVDMPKDKFYLGFEAYSSVPPKAELAPQLQRELEAVEKAVTILLESNISELKDIKRDPLPEEAGKASSTSAASRVVANKAQKKPLAERQGFEVQFVSAEGQLQKFINELVSSKEQFFVPKSVEVANQQDKGPSKTAQVPPPQPPTTQGGQNSPTSAPASSMNIILGDEKLNVVARIDIVNFAEPTAK